MASTLCVKPRYDIRIVPEIVIPPTGVEDAESGSRITDLVQLMRATCLDVAESAADSDLKLANSAICVAHALKLNKPCKDTQPEIEGLPADLAYMTWDRPVHRKSFRALYLVRFSGLQLGELNIF